MTITLTTEEARALRQLVDEHRSDLPPYMALTIRAELLKATLLPPEPRQ